MNERMARQLDDWLKLAEGALGIGFWTWAAADAKLSASAGFFELVGVNPAGVQLEPLFVEQLVHPKDRLAVEDAGDLATDSRQVDRRFRVIRPDGQLRWLHSQARNFYDREGVVTRVVAVVADISEQHAAKRRVGNLEALIHNLSTLLNAAFWIADENGRLIDRFSADQRNELSEQHSGTQNWRDIVHPDDVARVPAAWNDAVANKRSYIFNGRMLMADGQYRALHASGLPFSPEHSGDAYWGGYSATDTQFMSPATALGESGLQSLTAGQVRACRALLDWTAETLSARAGISVSTVRRLESHDVSQGQGDSMRLVMMAFREAGLKIWRGEDGRFSVSDLR